jgi:hypothetical protein
MKRTAFGIAVVIGTYAFAAASPRIAPMGKVASSCTLGGKKLYGKVKVVDHFPDFKVKVVDHFPDLNVQLVDHFPDSCGKWQLVDHFPDFTIQYVDHFPDFEIKKVSHFPGLP